MIEIVTKPSAKMDGSWTAVVSGDTMDDVQLGIEILTSGRWPMGTFTLPLLGADNRYHASGVLRSA